MKEAQTPAGRELSMPELYGEGPVAVYLRDIYALPGMPYGKESAESFAPLLQSVREEGVRDPVKLIPRLEGGYYLVEGYRRCHAAVAARLAVVPARIEQKTVQEVYQEAAHSNSPFLDDAASSQSGQKEAPKRIITHIQEMFGMKGRRLQTRKRDRGRER